MAPRKPRDEKTSNNPDGMNQWGKKNCKSLRALARGSSGAKYIFLSTDPDDETLSLTLHEYARRQYSLARRLQALAEDHGLVIA